MQSFRERWVTSCPLASWPTNKMLPTSMRNPPSPPSSLPAWTTQPSGSRCAACVCVLCVCMCVRARVQLHAHVPDTKCGIHFGLGVYSVIGPNRKHKGQSLLKWYVVAAQKSLPDFSVQKLSVWMFGKLVLNANNTTSVWLACPRSIPACLGA
eukprot:1156479-Pelagomonas_calceolata.AAC.4